MMSLRATLASELGVDRSTQKRTAKIDPQFCHIAWVVANDDVLTDVRRQGRVEIAEPLKMNAIRVNATRFGNGEQQQVELLRRLWQPRQKTISLPTRLGRNAGLAMRALVIILDHEGT